MAPGGLRGMVGPQFIEICSSANMVVNAAQYHVKD